MQYGSLFSGMGGIDLACDRAGMDCGFQAEMNEACGKVLGHHWPGVQRFQDVRNVTTAATDVRPGLIAGGFPCQDVSVAGRRAGLAGERTGLFWEFVRILGEFRPRWVLLENVPGLLSSWSPNPDAPSGVPSREEFGRRIVLDEASDFHAVVSSLGELGYGIAYRVLDAQWCGVPQRRRRVFIVGCFGDVRRAAEILFECESLPWDSPPSRDAGARIAAAVTSGTSAGSGVNPPGRRREDDVNIVSHTLRAEGFDASEYGTGRGVPLVPVDYTNGIEGGHVTGTIEAAQAKGNRGLGPSVPIDMRQDSRGGKFTNNRQEGSSGGAPGTGIGKSGDPSPTLADSHTPAIAYQCHGSNVGPMGTIRAGNGNEAGGVPFTFHTCIARNGRGKPNEVAGALTSCEGGTHADSKPHVADQYGVRRLMPIEWLRLQGFPDTWLDGLGLSDSAKYRMIGNAVAVPVVEWIAKRIASKP